MNFNDLKERIKDTYYEKKDEYGKHILGWSIFYLVDFAFVISFTEKVNASTIFTYLSTVVLYIGCFYLLVGIYVKFFPKRKINGVLFALASIIVFSGINCLWGVYVTKLCNSVERFSANPWDVYLFEIWRFSTASLYAFAYWIYLQRIKEQKIHSDTISQLYKAEVAFLKAQINPHFLFNTLNFVYGDVAEKSTKAGIAILSLTKLLRYSVESTKNDSSSLKKEADTISEYLNLQKLRFEQKVYVDFNKSGHLILFGIPPLVLLSLVENAFKYGIIDNKEHPIKINLTSDKDGLHFACKNLKRLDFKDKETTSVGIANIKRRLDLTYGDDYKLLVNEDHHFYEVTLNIIWKK
jgi:two-component system, LytTR family, sensor kinase